MLCDAAEKKKRKKYLEESVFGKYSPISRGSRTSVPLLEAQAGVWWLICLQQCKSVAWSPLNLVSWCCGKLCGLY